MGLTPVIVQDSGYYRYSLRKFPRSSAYFLLPLTPPPPTDRKQKDNADIIDLNKWSVEICDSMADYVFPLILQSKVEKKIKILEIKADTFLKKVYTEIQ